MAVPNILARDAGGVTRTINTLPDPLVDSAGGLINPDNFPKTFVYSGTKVTSVSFTNGTNTWTKLFTYTGDNLTGVSRWNKS